jgi:branched-subunit amino acid transport protein
MKLWIVIVSVGALNYLSRLSFIAFFANRSMPPLLARALRFVPAAMLTALIVPMIVASPSSASVVQLDARVPAALVAAIVAYFVRGTIPTLAAGMVTLWGLRAVGF